MFKRLFHLLFECPTFWRLKPAFTCPECGDQYRCYRDGHDVVGVGIDLCGPCAKEKEQPHASPQKQTA